MPNPYINRPIPARLLPIPTPEPDEEDIDQEQHEYDLDVQKHDQSFRYN